MGVNNAALSPKTGTGTVWGYLEAAFVSTFITKSHMTPLVHLYLIEYTLTFSDGTLVSWKCLKHGEPLKGLNRRVKF